MSIDPKKAIADIDAVLSHKPQYEGTGAVSEVSALMVACIERWAPAGSSYRQMLARIELFAPKYNKADVHLHGVLVALRKAYDQGLLTTFEELVHAAVFDDLVGQAEYFLDEGHRLPAAVVSGAALEEHLRQLAAKHGIATTTTNAAGKTRPRKASELNDDLHKAKAYSQPEWRQVQVWLDLRNYAAHADPDFKNRADADVRSMVDGIRAFIVKYPA
jgi:hypothetical protein